MASANELTQKLPPGLGSKKFLSTRRGTITLAVIAALGALGVLLLFMSNYRQSVQSGAADARVLVADTFIDKGTSGDVIAEAGLFQPATITEDEASQGAITDPSAIAGQVASEPIYRGQQLTADAFSPGADPVVGRLEGTQRALTLPVDAAQGNVRQLEAGSRIDILGAFNGELGGVAGALGGDRPVLDVLARDVLVLDVPSAEGGSSGDGDDAQVVIRVTDTEASRIAFAATSADIWLTVRPPTLGKDSKANPVQLESLLRKEN